MAMIVELPYEIGTVLKKTERGEIFYDKVDHYFVGNKVFVVLELCCDTKDSRLSKPIDISELKNWEVCNTKNK